MAVSRNRAAVVAAVATLAGAAPAASRADAAPVAYLQNFSAPSGMTALNTVNWTAYYGSATTNATVAAAGSTGVPANAMISGGPSAPSDGANVNATAATTNTATGFAALLSANGSNQFLLQTGESPINPAVRTPATFNWYAGSAYAGDDQQLAVEINGQWYASTVNHTPVAVGTSGMAFGPAAQRVTVSYDPSAGQWATLSFTPGQPLTLGSALSVPLPAGTITNFGVFATIGDYGGASVTNERTYVDSFEVTATAAPEPSSAALLCLGGAAVLGRRRRRAGR